MNTLPAKARLADHLIEGGLEALIRSEREKASSFETIAKVIERTTDGQVDATGVTVMAWASRLGIPTTRIRATQAAS